MNAAAETEDHPGVGRRLWTLEEYHRAAEAGLFRPEERLGLVEGEVIVKMRPQGTPHFFAIRASVETLESAFGAGADVRYQAPIQISRSTPTGRMSEPEPDLSVVQGFWRDYREHHPGPASILLLIEVSDTTLSDDRTEKARVYAAAVVSDDLAPHRRSDDLAALPPGIADCNRPPVRVIEPIIPKDVELGRHRMRHQC